MINGWRELWKEQCDSRTVKSELFLLVVKIRNQKYMHCKLEYWIGKNREYIPVIFTVSVLHRRDVSVISARGAHKESLRTR